MIKSFIKKHKESINFYLGILLIGSVVYLGPKFSKWYGENEKKNIDKNGKIVRGYVTYFYPKLINRRFEKLNYLI